MHMRGISLFIRERGSDVCSGKGERPSWTFMDLGFSLTASTEDTDKASCRL